MPPTPDYDLIVIGAGAAGLLGAAHAAERGKRVLLLEKNRKPGVKILMSGGSRCNLTQATDARGIIRAFGDQGSFLHSALAQLGPADLVALIEAEGVATKREPTGKIFPASDRSVDVLNALLARLKRSGAILALEEPVLEFDRVGELFSVVTTRRTCTAPQLLLTTGGQSYPGCGTTGDGYRWASQFGHTITPRAPALVPIRLQADWVVALKGITVPDVSLKVLFPAEESSSESSVSAPVRPSGPNRSRKPTGTERDEYRGSFLFTHWGCSGPAALNVSRVISQSREPSKLILQCSFLPDWTAERLFDHLRELAAAQGKQTVASSIPGDLPGRLLETLLQQAGVSPTQKLGELSKSQTRQLVGTFLTCRIPISGTLGYEKAEVTMGGVSLAEVDSRTMQSKRQPGLFLAGEILDLDGPIGGYNFQAAFSTGWLAAESIL